MRLFQSIFLKINLFILKKKIKFGKYAVYYINGSETLPPPLSKEEEKKAFKLLAENNDGAREKLIVHNLLGCLYSKKFESTGIGLKTWFQLVQ